jgi:hypothetical protein
VKDVDGVFTIDPRGAEHAGSELRDKVDKVDKVTSSELLRAATSLPIDRVVLELMGHYGECHRRAARPATTRRPQRSRGRRSP